MAGLSKDFGEAMTKELQSKESVNFLQELSIHEDEGKIVESLAITDVLIIGYEDDICESTVKIIELFKQHYNARPGSLLLPEVWYIGDQPKNPSLSSMERSFTNHARKYYDAEDIIYRHIILSNPTSRLGKVVLPPGLAVNVTLWWIRRGARYVHVANPGSALWGFFKFVYGKRDSVF